MLGLNCKKLFTVGLKMESVAGQVVIYGCQHASGSSSEHDERGKEEG